MHQVGNKCASNARGNLEKVEAAIGMGLDVLAMRDAAGHAQRGSEAGVERGQLGPVAALAVDGARREDAALVHHLHGRAAVLVGHGEDHLALAHNRVHVEDVTGDELLQEEAALAVAQLIERAP